MNRMSDVRSVAANTTVDNVMSGKLHEFLPVPSVVRLSCVASAAGIRATLIIGGEVVVDSQEVSGANRYPILPDDIVGEGAGFRGDRVVLRLQNTTAGALTVNSVVDVTPIPA